MVLTDSDVSFSTVTPHTVFLRFSFSPLWLLASMLLITTCSRHDTRTRLHILASSIWTQRSIQQNVFSSVFRRRRCLGAQRVLWLFPTWSQNFPGSVSATVKNMRKHCWSLWCLKNINLVWTVTLSEPSLIISLIQSTVQHLSSCVLSSESEDRWKLRNRLRSVDWLTALAALAAWLTKLTSCHVFESVCYQVKLKPTVFSWTQIVNVELYFGGWLWKQVGQRCERLLTFGCLKQVGTAP